MRGGSAAARARRKASGGSGAISTAARRRSNAGSRAVTRSSCAGPERERVERSQPPVGARGPPGPSRGRSAEPSGGRPAETTSSIARRAASSASWRRASSMASRVGKWRYSVERLTPASSATSRMLRSGASLSRPAAAARIRSRLTSESERCLRAWDRTVSLPVLGHLTTCLARKWCPTSSVSYPLPGFARFGLGRRTSENGPRMEEATNGAERWNAAAGNTRRRRHQ